jgi:hypothetical protein
MSCAACMKRLDAERPDISLWGRTLWTQLHGLAEKRTNLTGVQLRDLQIKWKILFDTLPNIIPCVECKQHCLEYLKAHPIQPLMLAKEEPQVHAFVRNWIYYFHEAVNVRLRYPSFPAASLTPTYSSVNLRKLHKEYSTMMELSIYANDIGILSWNKWKTNMLNLFSFYEV